MDDVSSELDSVKDHDHSKEFGKTVEKCLQMTDKELERHTICLMYKAELYRAMEIAARQVRARRMEGRR